MRDMPVSIFEMNRSLMSQAEPRRRARQILRLLQTKDRRRQRIAQRIFFLAGIQPAHDEDSSGDSDLAQHDAFIGGGDAEPLRASLLQCRRAFFYAMSVGIAFDDRADGDAGADMLLHNAEIVLQRGERNFRPVGPGFNAGGCERRCQALIR